MAEAKRAELERMRREVAKLEEELGVARPVARPVAHSGGVVGAPSDDDSPGVSRESTVELLPRDEPATPVARDSLRNALMVLLVSSIGNILEWFDFAVFGYFADTISVLFFPSDEPVLALAETFAVFAGAFCARPLGGIFFGYVGDRWGRKKAVLLSVRMMALATFCMGALPTYKTIGPLAPVALLVVRLFQGVSTGGQLVGSFLFTVEAAPSEHKALFGAVCFATANLGSALGSAVAALLRALLDEEQVQSWGWRIPFLLGLLAAIFGHAVKDSVHDSAETMAAVAAQDNGEGPATPNPLRVAFVTHRSTTLIVMGVACFWPTMFYIAFVWVASYEATLADPPVAQAFSINTVMIVLSTILFPPFGMLADKIGTRKFMLCGCTLCTVLVLPAFYFIGQGSVIGMAIGQLILVLIVASFGPGLPAWMVSVAPTECRYTIVGAGYNLAQAVLGGTAPLLATAAYGIGGSVMWTGAYFGCVGLLCAACLCWDARRQAHGRRGYTVQLNEVESENEDSADEAEGAAGTQKRTVLGSADESSLPPRP